MCPCACVRECVCACVLIYITHYYTASLPPHTTCVKQIHCIPLHACFFNVTLELENASADGIMCLCTFACMSHRLRTAAPTFGGCVPRQ